MFGDGTGGTLLDTVAHIIQVALTPVFLLTGIATLLNVFSTRLARVADRVEALAAELAGADGERAARLAVQMVRLHRRSLALDIAVVLAATGGAATCGAVLTLFVGAVGDKTVASVLFMLFGLAVVCALAAIVAYTVEMLLAGTGIRAEAIASRRRLGRCEDDAAEAEAHPDHAAEDADAPPPSSSDAA
jgi:Protein of unknown function (DUF2721)